MKLQKKVSQSSFYTDFVNILNGVLQLSNREAEVFALLLLYSDNGYDYNVNHKDIRSQVKSLLGISEANLSRYLNTLKVKGLIIKGKGTKWVINDNIKPDVINKSIEISFLLNIQDDVKEDMEKPINGVYTKEVETQTRLVGQGETNL